MDKLNTGFFNSSIPSFDSINFELQPKLFVNVPNQTKIKGKFKVQLLDMYITVMFIIFQI